MPYIIISHTSGVTGLSQVTLAQGLSGSCSQIEGGAVVLDAYLRPLYVALASSQDGNLVLKASEPGKRDDQEEVVLTFSNLVSEVILLDFAEFWHTLRQDQVTKTGPPYLHIQHSIEEFVDMF